LKKIFFFLGWVFFSFSAVTAQNSMDADIDSLFDEPLSGDTKDETLVSETSSVLDSVRRRGISVTASYDFQGIVSPGWDMPPWEFNGDEELSWFRGGKMSSTVGIDAQISEVFRVFTNIKYAIPKFSIDLIDFFFDYNVADRVFVRTGKYEYSWGISPNFGFTNLLSRVPSQDFGGPSYIVKADIPAGVGGIQALALTRANMSDGEAPSRGEVGYGGKYNLALRHADFDLGVFYQENMATRGFISIKTTVSNTELYNEWLVAVNTHYDKSVSFAFNFGFISSFFNNKLDLNSEVFYNREGDSYFFTPETNIYEAEITPFIEGLNVAFNMLFRFNGKWRPRFFTQVLYSPLQKSTRLVPGFRLSPLPHVEAYLAVPMALGDKDGYYYKHTYDRLDRPFSVMFYVSISGSVNAGYYY
jgi:hypothetical protein